MNEEIKELWATALESGEYQQGEGSLHRIDDTFCCMGVLCDLAVKAGVAQRIGMVGGNSYRFGPPNESPNFLNDDFDSAFLPPVVRKWAGLGSDNPELDEDLNCATANDSNHMPFAEIASFVRTNL